MRKRLVVLFAVVSAAVLTWFTYAAVRAHRNLVTLNVHNEDVRKVCSMIERQTWEIIIVQREVEGKVTLNVRSLPLEEVLGIIAEQLEVRWSALYPLYSSGQSLVKFKRSVRGEIEARENGWTNLYSRNWVGRGGPFGDASRSQNSLVSLRLQDQNLTLATFALGRYAQAQVVPEDGTEATVNLTLKQATFRDAVAKVAKQAHRKWAVFYALRTGRGQARGDFARRGGRGDGPPPEDGQGPPRDRPEFGGGPPWARDGSTNELSTNRPWGPSPEIRDVIQQQYEAQLAAMTPEERQQVEERRQFFEGLRDLPPEQRQQRMAEFMSRPEQQQRMQSRMLSRLKNTTPDQRVERDRERLQRQQRRQQRNGP